MVLDYDSQKIGLAGYTTDVVNPKEPFPVWAIVLIVLGGVAVIATGVVIFIKKRKARDMSSLSKYDTLSQ